MLIPTILNEGLEFTRIDRIPPTVGATHNYMQIVWITVQCVLDAIVAYNVTESFLQLRRDCVFTCVHVRYLGMTQSLRKLLPCLIGHVVRFTNVYAPDATFR